MSTDTPGVLAADIVVPARETTHANGEISMLDLVEKFAAIFRERSHGFAQTNCDAVVNVNRAALWKP